MTAQHPQHPQHEQQTEELDRSRMKLSREVRIGELIALLIALSTLAHWYIEQRLEPVKLEIKALRERNTEQDLVQTELKREIQSDLREIRAKLDRLVEGVSNRR
jgi:hypothetical protein